MNRFLIVSGLCIILAILSLVLWNHLHDKMGDLTYQHQNPVSDNIEDSNVLIVSNVKITNKPVTSEKEELMVVMVNAESGQYVSTSTDRGTVFLKDKMGHLIWSNNLAEKLAPEGGTKIINSIKSDGNNVFVTIGRSSVTLSLKDGKVQDFRSY